MTMMRIVVIMIMMISPNPPFYQLIVTAMDSDYQEEKGDDADDSH